MKLGIKSNHSVSATPDYEEKVANSRKFTQGFEKKVTLGATMKERLRKWLFNSNTGEENFSGFAAQELEEDSNQFF